jgi:uncharacterized membrane protein
MTSGGIRPGSIKRAVTAALFALILFGGTAFANPQEGQLNMTRGASTWSPEAYFLNNVALGVCVVIGILVLARCSSPCSASANRAVRSPKSGRTTPRWKSCGPPFP